MGFGLKELKLLFYTVKEVAAENKIPEDKAVQRFLEDIEKNYDNKLGYDSTLERIKSEIEKANRELDTKRSELGLNKEAVRVVTGLLSTGSTYQQILELAWFLQSVHINFESLKADLYKYGPDYFKKRFEVLDQKPRNLESQKKEDA
jgi:uncharacterized protein YpuA (DUF1002 family)